MADLTGDIEQMSLSCAYDRAVQLLESSDAGATPSPSQSQDALHLLDHCEAVVERAALFSRNEDVDDLVTGQLKYLLVPYHKAELLMGQTTREPNVRLQQLQNAHACYSQFLQYCQQYGFIKGSVHDAYTAEEQGTTPDPGICRNQKIERFKRSKAVNGLVQQMRSRRRQADEEAGTEGGPPGGVGGWDEEDERQLWTLQLEAAAIKALDSRPVLRQEMQLLQHVIQQQQAGNRQQQQQQELSCSNSSRDARPQDQQRQQLQQQMLNKLVGIAGQLSLTGDRQAARQQVFRPSHILPTLTVEQQGAMELAQAREREARQKEAEAAAAAHRAEQHSDDEDEDQLARARAWDDFKDDNPRGWGNSKLKPCA